jgi:C-terminal processing protease CtpA/Prc
MFRRGKTVVFLLSALVILYGVSAAFVPASFLPGMSDFPAFEVFMKALSKIDSDYVESPDMNKVQTGAMRGLIDALDPYSAFLTKAQVEALDKAKEKTGKVGVVLSKRANLICVVAAERGGPAEAAGVRAGDYLTAVEGANIEDRSLLEAESLLSGEPGSTVKVTLFRGAQPKPIVVSLVRRSDAQRSRGAVARRTNKRTGDGQVENAHLCRRPETHS